MVKLKFVLSYTYSSSKFEIENLFLDLELQYTLCWDKLLIVCWFSCFQIGGVDTVTLGDEEARARRCQKSILERKAPPTFYFLIEMRERHYWVTHKVFLSILNLIARLIYCCILVCNAENECHMVTYSIDNFLLLCNMFRSHSTDREECGYVASWKNPICWGTSFH